MFNIKDIFHYINIMENILINVDSRFRNKELYPYSGKFTLKLNQTIKDILYIRLSSIEIPNLYFTFSQEKQNISFVVKIGIVNTVVLIDDGFYDSIQMLNNINSKLPSGITINLNLSNGFITFEHTSSFSIDFTSYGQYPSLGYHLGFRKNTYNSTSSGTKHYLKSEALMDTIGDNYLFLRINDYGKMYNFNKSLDDYSETLDNYLGKVILSVSKAEKNFDNHNFITKKHIFRQPANISKLDVELIDPLGNTVNTQLMDFSFTLELGVIYDREIYEQSLNSLNLIDEPLYKISTKKIDTDTKINENIDEIFVNKPTIVDNVEIVNAKPIKKMKKKKFKFDY
jgi:hypothetical protein